MNNTILLVVLIAFSFAQEDSPGISSPMQNKIIMIYLKKILESFKQVSSNRTIGSVLPQFLSDTITKQVQEMGLQNLDSIQKLHIIYDYYVKNKCCSLNIRQLCFRNYNQLLTNFSRSYEILNQKVCQIDE